jgi:hypothetical protein
MAFFFCPALPARFGAAMATFAETMLAKYETLLQTSAGLRTDGTPYAAIIRRRCRCLDCGQVRIDKEYA